MNGVGSQKRPNWDGRGLTAAPFSCGVSGMGNHFYYYTGLFLAGGGAAFQWGIGAGLTVIGALVACTAVAEEFR